MAVYIRKDSPFFWIWLEGTSKPFSSKIPIGNGVNRRANKERAEAIYAAAMGDRARGVFKIPGAKATITFRAWAEWYRDNVVIHQRGHQRCGSMIKLAIRFFGDTPLEQIDAERIEEWKTWRRRLVKASTVNRELEMLKPMLQRAVGKYLESNPAASVRRLKTKRPPIAILSPSAEAALLAVANEEETLFVLLGLDALLRFGDVRRLRVQQDHGRHLEIIDPKTEPYKVPVSTRLRAALDAMTPRAKGQDGYFFARTHRKGWAPFVYSTGFYMFEALCLRAGVPMGRDKGGITFHSLRHTGATRAAKVVKLTAVRDLGGWRTLRQLERYDHPDNHDLIRAVEAIGAGSLAAVTRSESAGMGTSKDVQIPSRTKTVRAG